MPVVTIHAMPKWALPVIDEDPKDPVDPIDPDGPYSPEQQLTYLIGSWMPEIAAQAMDKIGLEGSTGSSDPDHVFVRFETMHAKTLNGPELYIVVSPMWQLHFTMNAGLDVRQVIAQALILKLNLRMSTVKNPTFDIDVDFMNGAGCSVNEEGRIIARW